ncbi:hypothetical protein ACLOJK_002573 [Asimina triloba]
MAACNFLFLLIFLIQLHSSVGQPAVKSGYWFPASQFPPSNINSALFTHLFCGFATLNPQSYQVTIPPPDQSSFSSFTKTVQQKNPSIKTILSIGGQRANPAIFAAMASHPSSRKAFIDSSMKAARDDGFHGLDLYWAYPKTTSQMTHMGVLIGEWRAAVAAESRASGQPRLILTADVYYTPTLNSLSYPIDPIRKSLDWINIAAYDLITPHSSPSATGAPAALFDPSSRLSASFGIEAWIKTRLSAKKLVMGLPFHGYAWRLADPNKHDEGSPANGPASDGDMGSDGMIGYKQIKEFAIRNSAPTAYTGANISSNYCYTDSIWIGFDDYQTVATKASFAKGKRIRGYYASSVGHDDNWVLSKDGKQL